MDKSFRSSGGYRQLWGLPETEQICLPGQATAHLSRCGDASVSSGGLPLQEPAHHPLMKSAIQNFPICWLQASSSTGLLLRERGNLQNTHAAVHGLLLRCHD